MTFELFRLLFDYYSFRDRENSGSVSIVGVELSKK